MGWKDSSLQLFLSWWFSIGRCSFDDFCLECECTTSRKSLYEIEYSHYDQKVFFKSWLYADSWRVASDFRVNCSVLGSCTASMFVVLSARWCWCCSEDCHYWADRPRQVCSCSISEGGTPVPRRTPGRQTG